MNIHKNLSRAHFSKIFDKLAIISTSILLVSCASNGDRMLHMSQYDSSRGETPEFMLNGYEDYKIKFSRENVKVENKVTFDEVARIFSF